MAAYCEAAELHKVIKSSTYKLFYLSWNQQVEFKLGVDFQHSDPRHSPVFWLNKSG